MHKLLIGAAAAALLASPALAADLYIQPAAPSLIGSASVVNWSGFYAGANVGYGWGKFEPNAPLVATDGRGLLGGLQAGYNYDFGGFVLGVEGDIQLADIRYEAGGGNIRIDSFGTLRARAGAAIDRFLPYVTGGLAYGHASYEFGGLSTSAGNTGWTVGAGLEYAATDNISVKAEYLYADFGDIDFGVGFGPLKTTAHVLRAGLNYKF